ncbi:CRISPR-associated exonuclease Cas4 [Hymenobacter luteus]|uniref:CRISPR-associated exonuclease Cas4 n=2 Tax=Hymenobacter TaxID=89966 RepID=A0A7W9WC29_9BACT|nr:MULTISPECIES: CRISPR-associated protein Cas4 [Hymenobacter]MBB4601938.1 CRISPR-associated exonuclease Cas4 [Hymenobacter latericoloratus]MBB6059633.1 CRISPR-associated exonuclease Cas4 [Hymenobacter luteus]
MSLTPSHLIEYLYCPRFTYFEYVLRVPQYEHKNYKVLRGRHLHDQRLEQNKDYLRRRLGVVDKYLDQYLTNEVLRGRVDEVLQLSDNTLAPLDYKFAEWEDSVYQTYQTQLYCYAWLIEETFGQPVRRGYLVYTRSRNKVVEVPIGPNNVAEVKRIAAEVLDILETNRYPKATRYKSRCVTCTYRNICTQ